MKEWRGVKNFLLVCFLFSTTNIIQGKELTELKPPSPKKIPFSMEAHGIERIDNNICSGAFLLARLIIMACSLLGLYRLKY